MAAAKIPCVYDDPVVLVDSVVGVFQSEGGEIGEYVDEYLVGKVEYCEAVIGSLKVRRPEVSA